MVSSVGKEKPKPRLTPEQNEARQEARRVKRERATDARWVAMMAAVMQHGNADERIAQAWLLLGIAKEGAR
jgi:hypothetical protein